MRKISKKLVASVLATTMVVGMATCSTAAVSKGTDVSASKTWSGYSIHTREDKGEWEDALKKDGQQFVDVDVTKESKIDAAKTFGENAKLTTNTAKDFTMKIGSTGWSATYAPTGPVVDGVRTWECTGNNPWGITANKIVKIEPGRTYNVSFKIKSTLVNDITKDEKRADGTMYNVKTGEQNFIKHVHVKFYRNNEKDGDPALPGTKMTATYKGKSVFSTTKADATKTAYTVIALDSRNDDYVDVKATVTVPGDKIEYKAGTIGIKFAFGAMLYSFPKENNMKGEIEVKDFQMVAADMAPTSKLAKAKAAKGLKVSLKAGKVKGAKKYEFQISAKKTFLIDATMKKTSKKPTLTVSAAKIKGTDSFKTVTKMKAKKTVYVRCRAKLAKGYSIWSAVKSVKLK